MSNIWLIVFYQRHVYDDVQFGTVRNTPIKIFTFEAMCNAAKNNIRKFISIFSFVFQVQVFNKIFVVYQLLQNLLKWENSDVIYVQLSNNITIIILNIFLTV